MLVCQVWDADQKRWVNRTTLATAYPEPLLQVYAEVVEDSQRVLPQDLDGLRLDGALEIATLGLVLGGGGQITAYGGLSVPHAVGREDCRNQLLALLAKGLRLEGA